MESLSPIGAIARTDFKACADHFGNRVADMNPSMVQCRRRHGRKFRVSRGKTLFHITARFGIMAGALLGFGLAPHGPLAHSARKR